MKPYKLLLLAIPCLSIALHAEVPVQAPPPSAATPAPAVESDAMVEDIIESGTNNNDPFASGGGYSRLPQVNPARVQEARTQLRLRMETWELPALAVVRLMDTSDSAVDAARVRSTFLAGENDARLLFGPSLGIDAHTKALNESTVEMIYPTEYESPELPPATITPADAQKPTNAWTKWLEAAGKHVVPTAFETRNTGETFEAIAQPVVIAANTWDVGIEFESVRLLGMSSYGAPELLIEMPVFSTFRMHGLYRMKEGQWRLLSVQNAPPAIDGAVSDKSRITFVRIDPTP